MKKQIKWQLIFIFILLTTGLIWFLPSPVEAACCINDCIDINGNSTGVC